ncbi:MAG: glycosyltransferase [bacterium]
MKVLTIGSDRKLFEEGSEVLNRVLLYAGKMKELHIIVFSNKKSNLQIKKIHNLSLYPTNSRSKLSYVSDAYRLGKKIIRENNFEKSNAVISTQDPFEAGLVGLLLKKMFDLKLQVQCHTDFSSPEFYNSFLNRIRGVIARFVIPRCDSIRVVSGKVAHSIEKKFPNLKSHIEVLPIFVDIERLRNAPITDNLKEKFPQFDFIFFMASRLTPEKNIYLALSAFAEVVKKFPKTGLVIAGEGSELKNLKKCIDEKSLSNNIIFIGWQQTLASFYKTADAFLLTSNFEGYGMTLVEAVACGCPVITTDVGIASELFKGNENNFICPVGSVDCFVSKMSEIISDENKKQLLKKLVQDSITATFSKEEYVNRYVGLLNAILE